MCPFSVGAAVNKQTFSYIACESAKWYNLNERYFIGISRNYVNLLFDTTVSLLLIYLEVTFPQIQNNIYTMPLFVIALFGWHW